MYCLMNKDTNAAMFHKENNIWKVLHQEAKLPIGNFEINDWLNDRKAYKHNHSLKKLMMNCGCNTTEGFIKITHAASMNDSFWVKGEDEDISWNEISFYKNDFNHTVSKMAFEGVGSNDSHGGSSSPELTTDGSFRKCWRKTNDGEIWLYKRGSTGACNAGLEPYCEALASEIIHKADPSSVEYSITSLYGKTASTCRSFTNDSVGFVPLRKLVNQRVSLEELLCFFEKLECREEFQRMLVLDAITFNCDRHFGNLGVVIDNDTQKIIGMAPDFDFNLSMLPYLMKKDFDDIGTKLLDYHPRIGGDFTGIGHEMLTFTIRDKLTGLKGYQFSSFCGNDEFEAWRIRALEDIVNRQIEAVLKGDILYTKEVFIPQKTVQEEILPDNTIECKMACILAKKLRKMQKFFTVMESVDEDNHVSVIATISAGGGFIDITVNMTNMEITCFKNGLEEPFKEICNDYPEFNEIYIKICKMADNLEQEGRDT